MSITLSERAEIAELLRALKEQAELDFLSARQAHGEDVAAIAEIDVELSSTSILMDHVDGGVTAYCLRRGFLKQARLAAQARMAKSGGKVEEARRDLEYALRRQIAMDQD